MPATRNEAENIIRIMTKYIAVDKLQELASELNEEVGMTTKNDSLKKTLALLEELAGNAECNGTGVGRQCVHIIDKDKRDGLVTYAQEQ